VFLPKVPPGLRYGVLDFQPMFLGIGPCDNCCDIAVCDGSGSSRTVTVPTWEAAPIETGLANDEAKVEARPGRSADGIVNSTRIARSFFELLILVFMFLYCLGTCFITPLLGAQDPRSLLKIMWAFFRE